MRLKTIVLTMAIVCMAVTQGFCTTYYVNQSGNNGEATTLETGKTTITAGIALLSASGGDTLLINDGTYAETLSTTGAYSDYNTIQAINAGSAIISGAVHLPYTSAYTIWSGFKFNYAGDKYIEGNHHKFLNCAFQGGGASGYGINTCLGTNDYPNGTSYILMEDCWFYGTGGRYNLIAYLADHIVFRRCVMRHDGGYGPYSGNPEACLTVYNSQYVELQNCIAIDSNLDTYVYYGQCFYFVYNSASAETTSNISVRGCIALNTKQNGYRTDAGYSTLTMGTFTDNVAWDFAEFAVVNGSSNATLAMTVTEGTFGNGTYGYGDWGPGSPSVTYSIASNISSTVYSGWTDGTGNTTSPGAALLYIPRTESGSAGANLTTKIGTSGTQYGDTGYATDTGSALWPFPNEDRIKTDMAAVSARGFCTGTQIGGGAETLTTYIWEYLGNQIPDTVYGGAPPTIGTSTLSPGTVGAAYNQTIYATEGTTPYVWEVTSGTLPSGLSLNTSTGAITGTPTTAGTSNFTVTVVDDVAAFDTQALSITINSEAVVSGATCPSAVISGGSF